MFVADELRLGTREPRVPWELAAVASAVDVGIPVFYCFIESDIPVDAGLYGSLYHFLPLGYKTLTNQQLLRNILDVVSRRMGVPALETQMRFRTSGHEFEIEMLPSWDELRAHSETREIVSREMPGLWVQTALGIYCRDVFDDANFAQLAVITARVCRALSLSMNEGILLRTGIVMVNAEGSKWTEPPDVVLKSLNPPLQLDMRSVRSLIDIAEGIDGVTSVIVADRQGLVRWIAFRRFKRPASSGLDIDNFRRSVTLLKGLGFFLPGNRSVHIVLGVSQSASPQRIHYDGHSWTLARDEELRPMLDACKDISATDATFDRLAGVVRLLSYQHTGSFIVVGNIGEFCPEMHDPTSCSKKIHATKMRPALSECLGEFSILEMDDECLARVLGLDGCHVISGEGRLDGVALQVRPIMSKEGSSLTGTKRVVAQAVTRLCPNALSITVSHDGPARLWWRGRLIFDTAS
jgi:hypothetical protein